MGRVAKITELITEPEQEVTPRSKKYAIGAGKGLGVLLSVALTAYISVQEAISDRPTKAEVKDDIAEVKAAYRGHEADNKEASDSIEALDEEVDSIEDAVIGLGSKVDSLDKKVSEGFDDIKEELRYLRRKR